MDYGALEYTGALLCVGLHLTTLPRVAHSMARPVQDTKPLYQCSGAAVTPVSIYKNDTRSNSVRKMASLPSHKTHKTYYHATRTHIHSTAILRTKSVNTPCPLNTVHTFTHMVCLMRVENTQMAQADLQRREKRSQGLAARPPQPHPSFTSLDRPSLIHSQYTCSMLQ